MYYSSAILHIYGFNSSKQRVHEMIREINNKLSRILGSSAWVAQWATRNRWAGKPSWTQSWSTLRQCQCWHSQHLHQACTNAHTHHNHHSFTHTGTYVSC